MADKERIKALNALLIAVAILAPMVLTYCKLLPQRHWPAVEGRVLEKATRVPIEDALVVVFYEGTAFDATQCFNMEMAKTGAEGTYHIPAWKNEGSYTSHKNQNKRFYVHSPGFKRASAIVHPGYSGETVYMEEFRGTREEYMEQLRRLVSATSCHGRSVDAEDRAKMLSREQQIVEIIYDEALSVLDNQEEWTRAEGVYLRSIERHLARKIVLLEFEESHREYSADVYDVRVREVLQERF